MAFTGRLGTPNSLFANIVLAAVDGLSPGSPDVQAHQLTSNAFRILFGVRVAEGALSPSSYSLASLAAPGTAYVPGISSVEFYDEREDSVVLILDAPLTTAKPYSATVLSVRTASGDYIVDLVRLFSANVVDPPRAVGAFLSKRGHVDVLYDRSVGPSSAAASFTIAPASGGPAVPMIQAAWASEDIPATALRLQVPPGLSPSDSFIVSTASVTDVSLNQSSETVPLTLSLRSPLPYSYADLTQLQLTDAFVTDVSSDFLRAANVRVFFSCPVAAATSQGSWSVSALGSHLHADGQDVLTAPPATDLASLMVLLNQMKGAYNSHVGVIDQVHTAPPAVTSLDSATAPGASGLPSAVALVNDLSSVLPSHFRRPRAHLYADTVNLVRVPPVLPGDLQGAMDAANALAASYSAHLLAEYPLALSSAYQAPVGTITAYCQEAAPNLAFDVSGPFTYFADLRVVLDLEQPDLVVRATLTSEDGGSSCTPSDYTGRIVARSGASPSVVTSSLVAVDRHVDLRADKGLSVLSDAPVVIVGEDGVEIPTTAEARASLPALLWAYNQALESYRQHIIPGAAGHQTDDNVNLVSPSDYAVLPLAAAISAANSVRLKVMSHMASATVHYHADPSSLTAPAATDLEGYMALVANLVDVLSSHLVRVGPHVFPGYRMVSAPVFDTVRLSSGLMKDMSASRAVGSLQSSYVYNGPPVSPAPSVPSYRSSVSRVDIPFVALAVRPSLASALPQSGLSDDPFFGPSLGPDSVQAFFSKPMREVPVTPSNLPVTGGPYQFLGSSWVSPVLASVMVTKMEPVPYHMAASGLTDLAGNEVF